MCNTAAHQKSRDKGNLTCVVTYFKSDGNSWKILYTYINIIITLTITLKRTHTKLHRKKTCTGKKNGFSVSFILINVKANILYNTLISFGYYAFFGGSINPSFCKI